ncbi:helix-turn-helix domain-containing protein [Flavobacterium psychrotrophum]|uniref:helix-turn-helix domain-containing protein n=1 Tax=Flavobacterium psychrotrophum TaxID=2294119 RepID=UPI000E316F8C|nr:helix-turn-helix domain-containing protein [Flavobacterium psychrotrophum]
MQLKAGFERANNLITNNRLKAANSVLNATYSQFAPTVTADNDLYAEYIILKALATKESKYQNFVTALERYKPAKAYNKFNKATLLLLLSDKLRESNNKDKAISILHDAENETSVFQNPYVDSNIYERLSTYFSGNITPETQKKYNEKFLAAYNKIQENEITALNSFYKLYKGDLENAYKAREATQYIYYYVLGLVVFLILILWYAMYVYKTLRMRKLKEIISYLEVPNKLLEKMKPAPGTEKKEEKIKEKKITMPDETERMILEKLKVFEQSGKFINPSMSLAMLAGETDVNTKYLSEVINKHYNDNYNTYINKLRINYIIEKLKNDPSYLNYKISYLAEESGFASHSSFTTVFRNIAGISPTEFINVISKQ